MAPIYDEEGKKYFSEDELKKKEEETEEEKEEEIDAEVDKVADAISIKIDEQVKSAVSKYMEKSKGSKIKKILEADKVDYKDVKSLTKEEKIVGFWQALVNKDETKVKALSEGTAADGGYLFPDEFRAELIQEIYDDPTALRNLVRVIPMKRDVMKMPTLTARPLTYWTEELRTKTTTSAEFNEVTLTAYKLASIIYASDELIDDSDQIDVIQLIISLFATEIKLKENQAIAQGSGTGQPTGWRSCTVGTTTCSGNLDFDDIINLIYSLPAGYRPNAKLVMANANIRELRKSKDSSNRYYWQEPVAAGQPLSIMGYPVIECDWVGEDRIYFGDFKRAYYLGDRQQMTVKLSQDESTAFNTDATAVRVVARLAGNCVLPAAMKALISIP